MTDIEHLLKAFGQLLDAAEDYAYYQHDGDPNCEDARVMGEMMIDDLERYGKLKDWRDLFIRLSQPTKGGGDE